MLPTHLSKAPITEALLDIRVDPAGSPGLDVLEGMHRLIQGDYPTSRPQKKFEANFSPEGEAFSHNVEHLGYVFWAADEKRAVQARVDGFSFSWLKPYPDWETFKSEARRQWAIFQQVAKPRSIHRIALRYINRFALPRPVDLGEHLNTFPQLGHSVLGDPEGFLLRLASTQPDGSFVVLTEAFDEAGMTEGEVPFILDIDVSRRYDDGISPDESCWDTFESLRQLKNRVFFDSIKDTIVRVFL